MRSSTSKEREGEKERKGNKGRERKKGEKGKGKGLREEKVNFFSEQKFWL